MVTSGKYNCLVVLGPTASGKTRMACALAAELNGGIISADSRQVYRHLNIGTGKDLQEYLINGKKIEHFLIDIAEPEEQFYLHQFIDELYKAFSILREQDKLPIICGGSGLYLDVLHKDFSLTQIPEDHELRNRLSKQDKNELLKLLHKYPEVLRKHVDESSAKRIIRGIEIADYRSKSTISPEVRPNPYHPYYIGIKTSIQDCQKKISERLEERLRNGMVQEVEALLKRGISPERLLKLGLEYKFVMHYLDQKLSFEEMTFRLRTAIFQFAKRQMTWFRKMEKEGIRIDWIDANSDLECIVTKLKEEFTG